ncbi:MAG: hypothetical protein ACHQ49_17640 [Elusimicrobiota bacterium]
MKSKLFIATLAAALLAASGFGILQWATTARARAAAHALAETSRWFPAAQSAARLMIDRYGPPQEASIFELRWNNTAPWKRIVVQDDPRSPLVDVVRFRVPADKLADIHRLGHGVSIDTFEDEISARGDREELNMLSLNLADDVVAGRMTPDEANRFYARLLELRESGKSSPYTERLLFSPPSNPYRDFPIR